jgi:hypothetical protein
MLIYSSNTVSPSVLTSPGRLRPSDRKLRQKGEKPTVIQETVRLFRPSAQMAPSVHHGHRLAMIPNQPYKSHYTTISSKLPRPQATADTQRPGPPPPSAPSTPTACAPAPPASATTAGESGHPSSSSSSATGPDQGEGSAKANSNASTCPASAQVSVSGPQQGPTPHYTRND